MGVLLRTSLRLVAPLALSVVALTTVLPAQAVTEAVPSVPLDVKAVGTFTGVELSWQAPTEWEGLTGYVVHRTVGGTVTTYPWVATSTASTERAWVQAERIPGATYSVAATSAEGEGPASTP